MDYMYCTLSNVYNYNNNNVSYSLSIESTTQFEFRDFGGTQKYINLTTEATLLNIDILVALLWIEYKLSIEPNLIYIWIIGQTCDLPHPTLSLSPLIFLQFAHCWSDGILFDIPILRKENGKPIFVTYYEFSNSIYICDIWMWF